MSSQHKTKLIGWHPSDPTLKAWVEAEARRRGITVRELLDEMAAEYRQRRSLDGKEIIHLNGNLHDNQLDNLEARTIKEER